MKTMRIEDGTVIPEDEALAWIAKHLKGLKYEIVDTEELEDPADEPFDMFEEMTPEEAAQIVKPHVVIADPVFRKHKKKAKSSTAIVEEKLPEAPVFEPPAVPQVRSTDFTDDL